MSYHIISDEAPFPTPILLQIAEHGPLDEISNIPGAVRSHIFRHGGRDETTGKLQDSMLFFVYQTSKQGPQNGFRLCFVHRGFRIASEFKSESAIEDDIDHLEKDIPQGHVEVVVLGEAPIVDVTEKGDRSSSS